MNYSFEYIDIILLAMIAGFIFMRLRGILGRRTENEESFKENLEKDVLNRNFNKNFLKDNVEEFNEEAKERFVKGAKAAYELIINSFAKGDIKTLKPLVDKNIFNEFSKAINERNEKKLIAETTFIGIKSAKIKDVEDGNNIYNVTIDFISEIITCIKDQNNKVISGDPDKIKIVTDTWKFSKIKKSLNPNWLLIETKA
mgnify:CR=1 FL=1|tara:strand:+ start:419 stop:1015 length:597 start_codon:yes stop_codon:yes gene_type:complete